MSDSDQSVANSIAAVQQLTKEFHQLLSEIKPDLSGYNSSNFPFATQEGLCDRIEKSEDPYSIRNMYRFQPQKSSEITEPQKSKLLEEILATVEQSAESAPEPRRSKLLEEILATVEQSGESTPEPRRSKLQGLEFLQESIYLKSAESAPVQRHTKHMDRAQITPTVDCLKLLLKP